MRTIKAKLMFAAFLVVICGVTFATIHLNAQKSEQTTNENKCVKNKNCIIKIQKDDTTFQCCGSLDDCFVVIKKVVQSHNEGKEADTIITKICSSLPDVLDSLHEIFNDLPNFSFEINKNLNDSGENHICKKIFICNNKGKCSNDSIIKLCMKKNNFYDMTEDIIESSADNQNEKVIIKKCAGQGDKKAKVMMCIIKIKDTDEADKKVLKEYYPQNEESKLDIDKLNFFPNPSDGKFQLNFKLENSGDVKIKIIDNTGKEIYKEYLNNFSGNYSKNIDISSENKGIYFIIIKQGDKTITKKIIME